MAGENETPVEGDSMGNDGNAPAEEPDPYVKELAEMFMDSIRVSLTVQQ